MEKYSVHKVIGEGSFGRALLVLCKSTQEKFVVKEIQLPKNRAKLENSRKEAVLLSKMKHPHIVAFRESFEVDDLLCIVMEYCGGGDLLQRIQQQKSAQFSTDHILRWFSQLCAAADHIHDQRVLHRDLKSKNIFLTDNGTIKLGDFGSACVLNSSKAYVHTIVGTPYYVAPEIWDNKPYNNKSDVWSLGCVLYELCTLRHPFQATSWKSLILKVCRGAYAPLPRHLPYELHHLIKQMFKTNPRDRPSLHTILTSHRVSRLLRGHLPAQAIETQGRGGRRGRWNAEEGLKVVQLLGDKSAMNTATFEGVELPEAACEGRAPRKQWAAGPSRSVMQVLGNADPVLGDSACSSLAGSTQEPGAEGQRRRWDKEPPERLLSLLEKVQLSRASSTFVICRGGVGVGGLGSSCASSSGQDPLLGPLSPPQIDATDGPEPDLLLDEERLQPRSDDEDTDFEEESPCDWMGEVENMLSDP